MQTIEFSYRREARQNPYTGFVSFQHFTDEALYSDRIVRPENKMTETEHVECYPVPPYVEEKGREEGWYPDASVAYFRFLWKEFEPREGEYRFDFLEELLKKAKAKGQTLMLRMMPHSTRESDDVPDWLKERIPCPARPAGKRVKESPSDPRFLEYYAKAVRALGGGLDGDPALAFLDISFPGAWGEGSSVGLFTKEQVDRLIQAHREAFPRTMLITQTCTPWLCKPSESQAPVGWRADCVGQPRLTFEMLPEKIAPMGDAWRRAHVSFESYWWLGEWKRQGWDLDRILETMLSWHVSSFNGKSLPIPWEWREKVEAFADRMGYHFVIRKLQTAVLVKRGERLCLRLWIENLGVAPLYHPLPLRLRLKNKEREEVFSTDIDPRRWLPGLHEESATILLPQELPADRYELQIGLGGEGFPVAFFATDAPRDADFFVLTSLEIE